MRKREFRNWKTEVRTQMIGGKEKIVGYAAVFNSLSEPMRIGNRTFRERVMPGAFDKCLRSNPDIRGLINHDPNLILGRTKSGTMNVASNARGITYEIDPPNTSYANDLRESMARGDIDQSSFGFYTIKDNWLPAGSDGVAIRELQEVDCFDVSPVTYPAYTGSSSGVEVRSFPDGLPWDSSVGRSSRPELEKRKKILRGLKMWSVKNFSDHLRTLEIQEGRSIAQTRPELTSRKREMRRMRLREITDFQQRFRR